VGRGAAHGYSGWAVLSFVGDPFFITSFYGATSFDFSENHVEAGVVDFRCPTVRLRKFVDFFLARYTRCTFFGWPTRFKPILENRAPFSGFQALSNEFGELVLRVRSVGSFLRHVLGGGSCWGMALFVVLGQ
jgi:hypothetical protein